MTEPTRDAQVLHLLKILPTQFGHYGDQLTEEEGKLLEYAAQCVREVAALREQVEALTAELEDIRAFASRQNDAQNEAMERGVQVRVALDLNATAPIALVLARIGQLNADLAAIRAENARLAESNRKLTTMLEEEAYHRMAAESRAEPDSGNVRIEVTDSAEVERLRAKAAIVDAMDAGRIAAFSKRKDGRVALYAPEHLQDFDSEPFVAETLTAAYAAAAREGASDAK